VKLASLRRKVDRLDDQMVRLLAERTRIAREIGRLKRQDGFSILAPGREASLLRRLEAKVGRRLDRQSLHAIYREILSSAREAQGGVRIAYLGPESSYCHQAAR